MNDSVQILFTVLVGLATGVLSASFGVGGAVISTPAIRVLGATPLEGVGSTLPAILPAAISGSMRYHREGLVRWRCVFWVGISGAGVAVGGAYMAGLIPGEGHLLMIATALLTGFTAWSVRAPGNTPDEIPNAEGFVRDGEQRRDMPWRLAITGGLAGIMSGLLGIGGGLVMVPAFSRWMRMPIKEAVGTSLACVGVVTIPSTLTHIALGNVNWIFALPLAIGVIPGAQIGAKFAIGASDVRLRKIVAAGLGLVATVYAAGEIIALLGS